MRWTWMAVLALVAGCDGIDLEQLVKQHAALTRVVPLPPGADCAHGGRALLAGLDLDDDGVLDDGEVTSTEALCATALTRRRPEPSGTLCVNGGQAVQTGVDADANGVLDDAEVTSTEYLCATLVPDVLVRAQAVPPGERCPRGGLVSRAGLDANGNGELEDAEVSREVYGCSEPEQVLARVRALTAQPQLCPGDLPLVVVEAGPDLDRDNALDDGERRAMADLCVDLSEVQVRLSPEPAGTRCPAGGTRVRAGLDADGDGELGDYEPIVQTYVCQPLHTYQGDYVVQSAADLAALQGISHLRGSLILRDSGLVEVTLPGLTVVEGGVDVRDNAALARLELPNLRFVGMDLRVASNANLQLLVLGGAERERLWVEADLTVEANPRLKSLEGMSFVAPRKSFTLKDNDALEYTVSQLGLIGIQALTGDLDVSGNDALAHLPFANLQHVGGYVVLSGHPALQSLSGLDGLRTVGGDFSVSDNDALQDLSGLSALESIGGMLNISANDGLLTTEGLTALVRVQSLYLSRNTALQWVGDMPLLQTAGSNLNISDHAMLFGVRNLPELRTVTHLSLGYNPRLDTLSGLAGVQRLFTLSLNHNNALTNLSDLASLREVAMLRLLENANLTRFSLEALQDVSMEFHIYLNPRLPTCMATALAAEVYTGEPERLYISGNDDTATCGN